MLYPSGIYFQVRRKHDEVLGILTILNDGFVTNKYNKPSFYGLCNTINARAKYSAQLEGLSHALDKYSFTEYDLIPL